MSRVVDLDHIVLVCHDVEATLAWYQRHLDLAGVRLDEWRAGAAPFPSLRVNDATIIDFIPGGTEHRGHLDHVCFVVSREDIESVRAAGELTIEDEGPRFGARGTAHSIYVRDPDHLLVELRAYPGELG